MGVLANILRRKYCEAGEALTFGAGGISQTDDIRLSRVNNMGMYLSLDLSMVNGVELERQ